MPVSGAAIVSGNIKKFGGGFVKHAAKVMKKAATMLDKEVTKNMSLTDHTQADLARLGHPYARRHGPEGLGIHQPPWLVHKQKGTLKKSKFKGSSEASILSGRLVVSGWVGLDQNKAAHASAIIWGTSKMIPRDVLSGSLFDKRLQSRISGLLQRDLRDLVVTFRGAETYG